MESPKLVLLIHGGAGVISKMSSDQEAAYRERLTASLKAGYDVLQAGGTAVEAVEAAIIVMEDTPLFNCGKGSVFTHDRTIEMDASIMEGKSGNAGAICGVRTIRNPITTAKLVMEKSEHVLLAGIGAEQFAQENGCILVDPSYFEDETRLNQLLRVQQKEQELLHRSTQTSEEVIKVGSSAIEFMTDPAVSTEAAAEKANDEKFGTVGSVALDAHGNIAAGTSTGGMINKRYGRVGDSPIIGAGTYASNETCAVSCTGHGEYFIRNVVAYDVAAVMKYKGVPLREAGPDVIQRLKEANGSGGCICVDKAGNWCMPFNTKGMYRGVITSDGVLEVGLYGEGPK